MAHIRKPTYTGPIPKSAQPCRVRGKPGVRWKGRYGEWKYGVICKKDPTKCLIQAERFRIWYTDHENRPREARAYRDRAAAEHLMQDLVSKSERIHAGLLDPRALKPRLALTELLDKWHQYILDKGATAAGARQQRQAACDICAGVEAVRVTDLTVAEVLRWVQARREANNHKGRKFGANTAKNYIGAIKNFTKWCAVIERCEPSDLLSALSKGSTVGEEVLKRRALSQPDLDKLLDTTRRSEEVLYGLTGRERHALYLTACTTGLRAKELADLKASDFDLETGEAILNRPAKTKTRAADLLPIHHEAMRAIKPMLKTPGSLWPNRGSRTSAWWLVAARMLRRDLEAAGIPFEVDGERFDFHCFRGQFATDLDRAGVSLVRAQKLMRHSDSKLTAKHYTKPNREEMATDVGRLKRGRRRGNPT